MPELPEVETIVRKLRDGGETPALPGMRIQKASIRWPKHIGAPSVSSFRRRIRGRVISDVQRRGKFLVLPLDKGTLLIHLRMSGDLYLLPSELPRGPYEHTIFHIKPDWQLRFSDSRKFGRVYLLDNPDQILGQLGPEPLDPSFTVDQFAERLAHRRRALKPLLLDQAFIAGLGNIYTDEALHLAGIHPEIHSDTLTRSQVQDLLEGIRTALNEGLRHNGASIDWVYRGGNYQNQFRVYQRTGKPCIKCGTPIHRITLGQRGTHFCPTCQPERSS